jgi:hypothetical protein
MSWWLRGLGIILLAVGLGVAAWAGQMVAGDTAFAEAAAAYARHPGHPLFQADYYVAAARYYGLFALVVGGLLIGLVGGSTLVGLSAVLQRVERLERR